MSAELLVNITPQETRVALLENGILNELQIERESKKGIVGKIYKGRVARVLPGMEAAFVDIGLEKAAFLHVSDLVPRMIGTDRESADQPEISIANVLREGMDILVQVIKDPIGTKGARITTSLTIPSRYIVLMPDSHNVGISSKIENDEERVRLKAIVENYREQENQDCGYILRTAAEGVSEEILLQDIKFLNNVWHSVNESVDVADSGSLIFADLPLVQRVLRDMVGESLEKISIDSRETATRVQQFCASYIPELADLVKHYPGERPIFDLYNVEDEIQKALEKKVILKSGGYLIIDQTEAMTTIDVNTGGFVGHRNLEETIFKTNMEAAQTIARQLRLRNLGGIIILDFIDMDIKEHRNQVLNALETALEKDHAKTYLSTLSSLGLVEMTRKRTRESLEHVLCEPCTVCSGRGYLKTADTICYEIFRELLREARQFDSKGLLVLASQDVVDLIMDEEADSVLELQEFINKPISFQAEALYTQENFDVVLM